MLITVMLSVDILKVECLKLSLIMPSAECRFAKFRNAECHYVQWRYALCHSAESCYSEFQVLYAESLGAMFDTLCFVMLSVIQQNFILL